MDWIAIAAWAVTTAIALTGAVTGLRAERRARQYDPLWVVDVENNGLVLHNRTGEDATRTHVDITGEGEARSSTDFLRVAPEGEIHIAVAARDPDNFRTFNVRWGITWTRPLTGREYRLDAEDSTSRGHAVRRKRREKREPHD